MSYPKRGKQWANVYASREVKPGNQRTATRRFTGRNPFGHSSTNLGSLYKSLVKDMFVNFKHLRRTRHTHDPLDDARGNAEALLAMKQELGLKISLE